MRGGRWLTRRRILTLEPERSATDQRSVNRSGWRGLGAGDAQQRRPPDDKPRAAAQEQAGFRPRTDTELHRVVRSSATDQVSYFGNWFTQLVSKYYAYAVISPSRQKARRIGAHFPILQRKLKPQMGRWGTWPGAHLLSSFSNHLGNRQGRPCWGPNFLPSDFSVPFS